MLGALGEEERIPLVVAELVPVKVLVDGLDPLLETAGVEDVGAEELLVLAAQTAAAKRCTSTVPVQ